MSTDKGIVPSVMTYRARLSMMSTAGSKGKQGPHTSESVECFSVRMETASPVSTSNWQVRKSLESKTPCFLEDSNASMVLCPKCLPQVQSELALLWIPGVVQESRCRHHLSRRVWDSNSSNFKHVLFPVCHTPLCALPGSYGLHIQETHRSQIIEAGKGEIDE